MPNSTPVQSFLGGMGLAIPVHFQLVLNGSVIGISGFIHNAVRGRKEAMASIAGLLMGGAMVAAVEGIGPDLGSADLRYIAFSGLLVGVGTKLSSGCTSGHMICGLSRFSPRSIAATLTFFATAALTTRFVWGKSLPPVHSTDWSLGKYGKTFLGLQVVPFAILTLLWFAAPPMRSSTKIEPEQAASRSILRLIANVTTAFNFAIALHLSNLTDPNRVISFLLLPFDRAFNPSLAYLGIGALPLATLLYHFGRGEEKPQLGGQWAIPKSTKIDAKLLVGAAIFGVGWGLGGVCPGPGLVNLGRALVNGSGIQPLAVWVGSVVTGGCLV